MNMFHLLLFTVYCLRFVEFLCKLFLLFYCFVTMETYI